MPSINEVWEQALLINANLAIVHNDLLTLNSCCEQVGTKAATIIQRQDQTLAVLQASQTVLQNGFTAVLSSLAEVHARQEVTAQLLLHQTKQQQAMICALEAISKNTCTLVNLAAADAPKQSRMAVAADDLVHLTSSAEPDAALALARDKEVALKLARCCPPGVRPEPVCQFRPCPEPGPFKPTKPKGKAKSRSNAQKS